MIKSAMLKCVDGLFNDLVRNIMSAISYSIINGSIFMVIHGRIVNDELRCSPLDNFKASDIY